MSKKFTQPVKIPGKATPSTRNSLTTSASPIRTNRPQKISRHNTIRRSSSLRPVIPAVRRKATVAAVISIAVAVLIAAVTVAAIAAVDVLAAEVAAVVADVPEHPAGAIFPLRNMPLRKAANETIAATSLVAVIAVALTSAARAVTSAVVVPKAAV